MDFKYIYGIASMTWAIVSILSQTNPVKQIEIINPNKYKLKAYRTVETCSLDPKGTRRQFICIEVFTDNAEFVKPLAGALEFSAFVQDSNYVVFSCCCPNLQAQFSPHREFFLVDSFRKFKGTVNVDFMYGNTSWASFRGVDIHKLIEPMESKLSDINTPLANRAWAILIGSNCGLVSRKRKN